MVDKMQEMIKVWNKKQQEDPYKRCIGCNTDYGQHGEKFLFCPKCGVKLEVYVPVWIEQEKARILQKERDRILKAYAEEHKLKRESFKINPENTRAYAACDYCCGGQSQELNHPHHDTYQNGRITLCQFHYDLLFEED